MKKPEAEKAIRYLVTQWARETGFDPASGKMPSFSAFKSWLRENRYDGYLNFRSTLGPDADAEQWFDEDYIRPGETDAPQMRKRLTDRDLAKLPGYDPDPEGRGYYFDSPTGRCAIIGAMPSDECHEHDRWGMINISKCQGIIDRGGRKPQRIPIDDGLKQNFAAYEFDQAWVDAMTAARRDEPVIMVVGGDGVHLVDGTHRLRRRVRDGLAHADVFLLKSSILRATRVRLMRQQADGSWKQDGGPSDDELDREIEDGKTIEQKMIWPKT